MKVNQTVEIFCEFLSIASRNRDSDSTENIPVLMIPRAMVKQDSLPNAKQKNLRGRPLRFFAF